MQDERSQHQVHTLSPFRVVTNTETYLARTNVVHSLCFAVASLTSSLHVKLLNAVRHDKTLSVRLTEAKRFGHTTMHRYLHSLTRDLPHINRYVSQERVTDHRIGLTLKNLSSVLEGDGLEDFIDALKKDHDESVLEDMISDTST
jgi:hypothetical protein